MSAEPRGEFMSGDERHGPAGQPPQRPDRLDSWFRWIASLTVAALIIMALHYVMHAKPPDPAAKHDDRTRVLG